MFNNQILEVEGSLQDAHVFINGLRRTPAHQDSYMTIIDESKLKFWLSSHTFSDELLFECIEYWQECGPTLRLLAFGIDYHLKNKQNNSQF